MARIYHLSAVVGLAPVRQCPIEWDGYDVCFEMVVRARSASHARNIASKNCGSEGPAVWQNPDKTNCVALSSNGKSGVIVRDVLNGM